MNQKMNSTTKVGQLVAPVVTALAIILCAVGAAALPSIGDTPMLVVSK